MANSTGVSVTLKGERIPVKASADSHIADEVVQLAQARLDQVIERNPNRAAHHIALLALLDLAQDHVLARKDFESFRERVLKRIDLLEEALR